MFESMCEGEEEGVSDKRASNLHKQLKVNGGSFLTAWSLCMQGRSNCKEERLPPNMQAETPLPNK